jgi:hypothetical protein
MEPWEQDLVQQEYLLRSEKTRAETLLLQKQASHIDVVADLAKSEKRRGLQAVSVELKRQINSIGIGIAEYEAQLPIVLKQKEDLAAFDVRDNPAAMYEQRKDLWRLDEWLARQQAAYDFALKQIDNLKTELLQHLTKEA